MFSVWDKWINETINLKMEQPALATFLFIHLNLLLIDTWIQTIQKVMELDIRVLKKSWNRINNPSHMVKDIFKIARLGADWLCAFQFLYWFTSQSTRMSLLSLRCKYFKESCRLFGTESKLIQLQNSTLLCCAHSCHFCKQITSLKVTEWIWIFFQC